ncbi:MAG: flagellar assembly protein FliW [Spirochaetia bacterium]|uniref:flagellar assembly protein FliW n=1 Tax=Treponema berlinense TaxID=225004 RepID=UPI0015BD1B5A|nr:flagellar assembly protein FliW [Treponema berlinense]MDD5789364.1 flagellar assembly protein FliW [Spirochaetia bacterium]
MQVETKTMGTVTVDENQIVTFPNGLYGFEEYHRYAIIEAEYQPFYWLQSLDEKNLAFIIVDPFLLVSDYELDIDDRTLCEIGIDSPGDVILFAIITIPADGSAVTANLQGPVVINRKNSLALQVILSDSKWTTKHNIIKALNKKDKK